MTDGTNETALSALKKEYPLYKISQCGDVEKVLEDIKQFKTCELVEELKSRTDICKSMFIEPDCCYYIEIASPLGELVQYEHGDGAALVLIITD